MRLGFVAGRGQPELNNLLNEVAAWPLNSRSALHQLIQHNNDRRKRLSSLFASNCLSPPSSEVEA
jgi:hypothetical protein